MIRYVSMSGIAAMALGAAAILVPVVAASGQAAASGLAATVPGRAAGSGPGPTAAVEPGINAAALPGATKLGSTPGTTTETVSFVMRERNLPALEAAAEHGVQYLPGRKDAQGNYLSVGQFAGEFGQGQASIKALVNYLARFKIKAQVYPDRVDVVATGTAAEFTGRCR
jgi:hypothetical protein